MKRVPTPFSYVQASAVVADASIKIKQGDWESLRGYSVGYMRGAMYAETGLKGFVKAQSLTDNTQMFEMLEKGRIDVAIAVALDGRGMVNKLDLKNVQANAPVPIHRLEVYHYLHESKAEVIAQLDKVIKEMKASGELALLREKLIDKILRK